MALAVIGLLGLTLFGWDEWRSEKHEEEKVALTQVPALVKTTIEQEARLGALKEIEKTTVDDEIIYAASVAIDGKEQETRIGEDGKVISRGAHERDGDD